MEGTALCESVLGCDACITIVCFGVTMNASEQSIQLCHVLDSR